MNHPSIDELTIYDLYFAFALRHTAKGTYQEDALHAMNLALEGLKIRHHREKNDNAIPNA